MRRPVAAIATIAAILIAALAPIGASALSAVHSGGGPARIVGMVPVHPQARSWARPSRVSNLAYHGGPVMRADRVYTIFWTGSGSWDPGYIATVNAYFGDVAHDSGLSSNVYYSDTQYYDDSGSIAYSVALGGTVTDDTTPYPANGCTDKATSICLSDAQLQAEIQAQMSAQGWSASSGGTQNLFFIFTPQGVGSCAGSSCAYSTYCAYHSWMGSGSSAILYANQPYAVQNYRIYTCDSGQRPNGVTADATINLVSHEHNEAITDEQGSAWYDSSGNENGDKCAWNFGSAQGPSGGQYNQVINGHHYYLQQEWSNARKGCVLTGK